MSCIMSYAWCFPDMPSMVVADGTGTSWPCIHSANHRLCFEHTEPAASAVCCRIIRHVAACSRNAVFNRSCIKHPKCYRVRGLAIVKCFKSFCLLPDSLMFITMSDVDTSTDLKPPQHDVPSQFVVVCCCWQLRHRVACHPNLP